MYDSQRKAVDKYLKEKTDDIRLRVPKGTKDRWRSAALKKGYKSMTSFVVNVVEKAIDS